ncbi:LysR family transcriptional regulator, partial [Klebsiella pneumoniae]|nr:LysR family transcriptional regulator [Klebsiella pneumoniae]
ICHQLNTKNNIISGSEVSRLSVAIHYPDIRLELISESRFVDIIAQRFDAGVRLGPEVGSGMIAVRISPDMEMAVVGTPEHFRRYG